MFSRVEWVEGGGFDSRVERVERVEVLDRIDFGLSGVVGGMMVIELLAYTMRRGRWVG